MKMERLSITMPAESAEGIRGIAEVTNTTVSGVIREALMVYIREKRGTAPKDTDIAELKVKINLLEQRLKDKDEVIKAKNETIGALSEALGISQKEAHLPPKS